MTWSREDENKIRRESWWLRETRRWWSSLTLLSDKTQDKMIYAWNNYSLGSWSWWSWILVPAAAPLHQFLTLVFLVCCLIPPGNPCIPWRRLLVLPSLHLLPSSPEDSQVLKWLISFLSQDHHYWSFASVKVYVNEIFSLTNQNSQLEYVFCSPWLNLLTHLLLRVWSALHSLLLSWLQDPR